MAIGLKFWLTEEEGLNNLCGENKGADQLCGYQAADLGIFSHTHAKSRFSHDMAQMSCNMTKLTKLE